MHHVTKQRRSDEGLARFGEPGLLILISLSNGPKHGYAMTVDIKEQTGISLGPGTLYGSIVKLLERGMIEALPSDDRRRPYQITNAGRDALAAQVAAWSKVVQVARLRLGTAGAPA